ncbi:MAG TPA: hypothetical protein VES40_18750 [Ilumatobacteraceae bacterium]|nr:hypothetical protein [Ilumatobacteraceae bacterium]
MNITSNLKKTLCVTVVAGTAMLTLGATAAHAQEPGPAADSRPRIERACARIPNLQTRVDNGIARINGAADVRGSIAWLEALVGKADTAGRTDLAAALRNRVDVRKATLGVLQLRQANLVEFAALCDARES